VSTAADLDRADPDGAGLNRADPERAGVDRADLDRADLDRADLDRADLDRAGLDRGYRQAAAVAPAARRNRRIYLPTLVIAGLAGWLAWRGWAELSAFGLARSINAGRFELAGPVVLGFVVAIFLIEQARPAVRRRLLARGHVVDMCYLLAYALAVVPLIVLIGSGFSAELARLAPWLVIPPVPGLPRWVFIALAVIAIDFVDWLAHLGNHRINSLWRLHAVHHSQEELSIFTTFRAHPLVHVSFLISAIPILAISSNATTPTTILTIYACLGALPHANVRWTYGRVGRVLISPAYHRIHHAATGRIDINLGTVFAVWDALSRRAVFPAAGASAGPTGLSGRPIPVEQAASRRDLPRTFLTQWTEPFSAPRTAEPFADTRADTREVPNR
jgi:sterol desaturase/sphingolipid hydroxylase (fatty acid hydroxylase superfamily)